jgi:hypothetical protein
MVLDFEDLKYGGIWIWWEFFSTWYIKNNEIKR